MSGLTKERVSSVREVTRDVRPLAASVKALKGGDAACNSSGYYQPATGAPSEVVVGWFYNTVDNTAGGNGAQSCDIHFSRERHLRLLDNDTGTPVTVASREQLCSQLDDHTVTGLKAGMSDAGIVYDVTSEGVWVERVYPSSSQDSNVPAIQSGTTTLVAGTKTVSGVVLTSTSRIFLTMKDPGSGAVTGLGALDAPVASRNTGAGTFVINAIDDSKAVITTAVSTVDYLIIG